MGLSDPVGGSGRFEGATVQDIHDVLYGDGAFIKAFHDMCGSANVSVSQWQDGIRLVSFELKLTRAPTFITSITGSQVNIVDRQACVWEQTAACGSCASSDTESAPASGVTPGFRVSSTPEVQISGGKRFVSNLCISFAQRSCDVHACGSVEVAANIWGLQGSIEPVMLREARTQLASFFEFARQYYYSATKPGIHLTADTPAGSTIAPSVDVQPTSPLSGASSSEAAPLAPADVLSTQALPADALAALPPSSPPQRVRSAGQSLSRAASPHSEDFQDVMDYVSSDGTSVVSGVDEAPAIRADVQRLQREVAELRAEVAVLKEAKPVADRMRHLAALGNELADELEHRVQSAAHKASGADAPPSAANGSWGADWVSGMGAGVVIGVVLCAGSCVCMAALKPR